MRTTPLYPSYLTNSETDLFVSNVSDKTTMGRRCCVQELRSIRARQERAALHQRFIAIGIPQKVYGKVHQVE